MATILQVAGAVLVTAGIGLFSIPAGLIFAGIAAVAFGIALERR
jgi:uncharacterized membrane-anchored protein YitT (DUF2179 family)